MCNHYSVKNPEEVLAIARRIAAAAEASWEAVADAWPKRPMPVVYVPEGKPTLAAMRWGVWPWYEDKPRLVTNARDDKLATSRLWSQSAQSRRCLVPADGFFEPTGPSGAKWEVRFSFRDARPFFFAGLWSADPRETDRGFALVTGKPNDLVAALPHDRMPVILDAAGADEWLHAPTLSPERMQALLLPYPAAEMIREDMPRLERTTKAKPSPSVPPIAAQQTELF
ncbi:MAG TPA: SOS response-associated peptidase [Candidatus Synoicihabitans sp.]|nr:SOS response-associated peptidase [Candidatus Synoicihabitans sp.]